MVDGFDVVLIVTRASAFPSRIELDAGVSYNAFMCKTKAGLNQLVAVLLNCCP